MFKGIICKLRVIKCLYSFVVNVAFSKMGQFRMSIGRKQSTNKTVCMFLSSYIKSQILKKLQGLRVNSYKHKTVHSSYHSSIILSDKFRFDSHVFHCDVVDDGNDLKAQYTPKCFSLLPSEVTLSIHLSFRDKASEYSCGQLSITARIHTGKSHIISRCIIIPPSQRSLSSSLTETHIKHPFFLPLPPRRSKEQKQCELMSLLSEGLYLLCSRKTC